MKLKVIYRCFVADRDNTIVAVAEMEKTLDSLIITINAVLPVFVLILLGMFLRHIKLLNGSATAQLNRMLFTVLMPVLLFTNIYHTEIGEVLHPGLILFCLGGLAAFWILVSIIVCLSVKDIKSRGAAIQGISRPNFILFGLPLVSHIVSRRAAGVTSIVAAFVVPVLNLLSVVTLEVFRHEKINIGKIIRGIVTNPLIIGSMLGIIALMTGMNFPTPMVSVLDTVSSMASPFGLIVMGASLEFDKIKGNRLILSLSVVARLILIPAAAITVGIILGFRGIDILTIAALFAAPTAVASYPMAVEMDSDHDLACQIVVFTTLLACFTNFGILFVIGWLGFI